MADSGMYSCRRSLPDATYCALRIIARGQVIGRASLNRVRYLQTASASAEAYSFGNPLAMESSLITPSALMRTGAAKVVTS